MLFFLVCFTRTNTTIQSGLFVYICFLVLLAEYLNAFCAENWESFATQNYFDKHGSFAAVVYAAPLLVIALLQMVCDCGYDWQASFVHIFYVMLGCVCVFFLISITLTALSFYVLLCRLIF